MKLSQIMITPLLVALLTVIYAAVPAAANVTPPANNCCTMYHRCIKSSLCTTLDCVCSSDVEDSLSQVDAKPPANNCCTMNNQCVKSELCKELDCVCSSPVEEGKMKATDGKVAFMSPRNVERLTVERNGMVKKGMRVTEH